MRVAMFPAPGNAWRWRLEGPAKYLQRKSIDARIISGGITKEVADWADIYVLENCVDKDGIALLYEYQQTKGKKIVVECDDWLEVDPSNPHKIEHELRDAHTVITRTMEVADMVTCTTDYLAKKLRTFNKNVVVLPNYTDMEVWDLKKKKNTSNTIRIGWAGSLTHIEDLKMIVTPLKRICDEFPNVRLIFVGETRIKEYLSGYPVEVVLGVPFELWPDRLHGLRLDIGVAPLVETEFNRCKSNIKWQEYAIAQIPGVYSPTVYYKRWFEGKLGMIAYTEEQWYMCLKNYIINKNLRDDTAEHAYSMVRSKFDLKKRIYLWVNAYRSLFDPSSRKCYTKHS